jgi:hypothetical protein
MHTTGELYLGTLSNWPYDADGDADAVDGAFRPSAVIDVARPERGGRAGRVG